MPVEQFFSRIQMNSYAYQRPLSFNHRIARACQHERSIVQLNHGKGMEVSSKWVGQGLRGDHSYIVYLFNSCYSFSSPSDRNIH